MIEADLLQLLHAVLLIVGALLPVVNPPGNVPIFLTLTRGCDEATRRDLARHIALYSFALLAGSMLFGSIVLRLFDLSVWALQLAGGAVVIALGWKLLHHEPPDSDALPDPHHARKVATARAFYPLTLPVSIDAGAIAVAITLGANHGTTLERDLVQIASALIGSAVVAASLLLAYRYAGRVSGWLGNKGMEVMLRLSALLVMSIGVQICWNGVRAMLGTIGIGTHA